MRKPHGKLVVLRRLCSLDPEVVTPTMANYAKSIGIRIYTNCAVRIETAGGKISDVVTEKVQSKRLVLF